MDEILSRQNPDGGWGLAGGGSDVDLTAMALQALAKYRDNSTVSAAVAGLAAGAGRDVRLLGHGEQRVGLPGDCGADRAWNLPRG